MKVENLLIKEIFDFIEKLNYSEQVEINND
jgi:hypothetical protein